MKSNLQFDFLVNKENNSLTVRKSFAAKRQLVWDCYTTSALLEQWFAPKPWTAKTKIMDFREGGRWQYAMCGPEGEVHWGIMEYHKINPIEGYVGVDAFCDADGNLNTELPRAIWNTNFHENSGKTLVETVVTYPSFNDLETILQMGMKEGLTACIGQLDELLLTLKSKE